jgi:N utilization substance protein A
LSVIEPEQLVEMSGLTAAECDHIVEYADKESARLEAEERFQAEQRKLGVGSTASRSGEAPVSAPVATSDIASGAGEP